MITVTTPRPPEPEWITLRVEDTQVSMLVEPDAPNEVVADTLLLLLDAQQHRRERSLLELGLVDLGGEGGES